ncbi:hypothetical protein OESDEN_12091 [Oesophagostomum dentatum]|uniref:Uncharacterized protein n=1 Tax=Oesophagostomum dentatum TaxID=61180 RepID=A0A0B1SXA3_OESDE|nr:hypothetical protein OESDEN_12091 [Oesophagostomum dentatum]
MHIAKVFNFYLDEAEFEELTKADGYNVTYNNEPDLLVFASMVRWFEKAQPKSDVLELLANICLGL